MAKKNERDAHREQAAEPANEQPIVALRFIEINKQGQLVSKTEHLHQNAERARKRVRQLGKRRKRWRADPAKAVAKELWPPRGKPPETVSTPDALKRLSDELADREYQVPSSRHPVPCNGRR